MMVFMNILNYYVSGITANGYISLIDSNINNLDRVYYVKAFYDYSAIIDKIKLIWSQDNGLIEYIHNPFNNDSLEGIINRRLNIGVLFSILPYFSSINAGSRLEIIELDELINADKLDKYRHALLDLKTSSKSMLDRCNLHLSKALRVHDEWERIYISNMDFSLTEQLASQFQQLLINDTRLDKQARIIHRFLGAATPNGARDFILNITDDIDKRYFIKGRPGTGKSTFMKRVANYASDRGIDVEIYHCGFDHNSLDMIIMRELNVCIFDSTAPHEHFPTKDSDEIIDIYEIAIERGTDDKYKDLLSEISERYRSNIAIATSYLKTVKAINNEILYYNSLIIDNDKFNDVMSNLILKLK